ncbi:DUF4440 domain-containing protein [Pollutibacter soli]|uniref:nuclear transport factor 2 family protein n=1 Tax=Pollutibacter soli TaxID=3034157 RepID=UPI003013C1E6
MKTGWPARICFSFIFTLIFSNQIFAQQNDKQVAEKVYGLDSLFWVAYNNCDVAGMQRLIDPGIEFFHDKGGITKGIDAMVASIKNNLCSNPEFRVRREAVPNTVKAFPMSNGKEIYGVLVSGDHYFYNKQKDKNETLEGLAKFSNLWILINGEWKMSRVFSYDHGPAPFINKRKMIALSPVSLDVYTGIYTGTQTGDVHVKRKNDFLVLGIGNSNFDIFPETDGRFFSKERDLVFEFRKDPQGKIKEMIVIEKGNEAERLTRK